MKSLPRSPDIDHLKGQAKALLASFRCAEPEAVLRFRNALPFAVSRDPAACAATPLHLHDAQSCIARAYGFDSWADLGPMSKPAGRPIATPLRWRRSSSNCAR